MLTRNVEKDGNDIHVTMHDAYCLAMVWTSERRSASSNSARHAGPANGLLPLGLDLRRSESGGDIEVGHILLVQTGFV